MILELASPLHQEKVRLDHLPDDELIRENQVIAVLTGGTEALFLDAVRKGDISLERPIILLATGSSNSLAAAMEILSWIHQHDGHGQIRCNW